MALLLVASGVLMGMMALPRSTWGYAAIRFLQVLCAAPIFPLVVARRPPGERRRDRGHQFGPIGGSFIGPVLATSILSVSSRLCSTWRSVSAAWPACLLSYDLRRARRLA